MNNDKNTTSSNVSAGRVAPGQRLADKLGFVVGAMIAFSGAAVIFAQSASLALLSL